MSHILEKLSTYLEYCKHPNEKMRQRGSRGLVKLICNDIAKVYIEILDTDESAENRRYAALQLRQRAVASKSLAKRMLNDDDCGVRLMCAESLRTVPCPANVSAFIKALDDDEPMVVATACRGLAESRRSEAIAPMMKLIHSDSWVVRVDACYALLMLGVYDKAIIDVLRESSSAVRDQGVLDDEDLHYTLGGVGLVLEFDTHYARPMSEIIEEAQRMMDKA